MRQQVEYWTLLYKPVISSLYILTVHPTILYSVNSVQLSETDRQTLYYAACLTAPAFINFKFNFSHDWTGMGIVALYVDKSGL